MTIESELGRCLENSPGRQAYDAVRSVLGCDVDEESEDRYGESIEEEPEKLLFHGSPAELNEETDAEDEFEKIEERYGVMREDARNITERYGKKELVMFEDEYEVLDGTGRIDKLENMGLDITVEDSDQDMAYDDWKAVEDAGSVRSYTSAGNRQKLQELGEDALPDTDITVLGTPRFDMTDSVRHSVLNRFIDTPLQKTEFGKNQIRDENSVLNRTRGFVSNYF